MTQTQFPQFILNFLHGRSSTIIETDLPFNGGFCQLTPPVVPDTAVAYFTPFSLPLVPMINNKAASFLDLCLPWWSRRDTL
jgi:hypothetical protein